MFSSNKNPENVQVEKDGQRMASMDENANNEIVNSIKATTNCFNATHVDNLKISRKKKDLGLVTAGHFRNIINLEKKKHNTSFNQLQLN